MCIFPYDGTNRIRFTGKGYKSHSQPDASGPPKTYLQAICDHYTAQWRSVKKKGTQSGNFFHSGHSFLDKSFFWTYTYFYKISC